MTDVSYYKAQFEDCKKRLEEEEHKAACETIAKSVYTIYAAMKEAGFDDDKAWDITYKLLQKAIDESAKEQRDPWVKVM